MNRREALRTLAVGSACGALAGGTVVMAAPSEANAADPLLDLVTAYRAASAMFEATAPDYDDDAADALLDSLIGPHYDRLKNDPPAATTEAGAVAALRLAWEEGKHSYGGIQSSMVGVALAYFEGRA